uniref:SFRICE_038965 n=1 Tax=Spodoptera frugiperda TaxID=7108 RepID=A0A2H1W764_SPOFR
MLKRFAIVALLACALMAMVGVSAQVLRAPVAGSPVLRMVRSPYGYQKEHHHHHHHNHGHGYGHY